MVGDPEKLPQASLVEVVPSPLEGYISGINAREVGETSVDLGAGRIKKGDPIDPAVGILILHKVGDRVDSGEPLFVVHANDKDRLEQARERLLAAHSWSKTPCDALPLFYGVVE